MPLGDKIAGTKTEQNLHTALAAESQAYLRYNIFASKAKKEGYVRVSQIFEEIAHNEFEHAEIWFSLLGGAGDTERNLSAAAEGEKFEWTKMYAEFAKTARAEGFEDVAGRFERIAAIEQRHEERYRKNLGMLESGHTFRVDEGEQGVVWVCLACGQIVKGDTAPQLCPTCGHPQGYFARYSE